ncbi:MAG: hypothetical protein KAV87_30235 [Desulfobacteraceae bacterium]|nr:hypothetical protein [Desulfobacteraceae bacterium]
MNIKAGVLIISYVFMIYLASQKPSMAAEGVDSEAFEALKADCAQWVKRTEGLTVVGDDGWLFSRNELRHISVGEFWGKSANEASRARRADRRDPIPAILDFKEKLDRLGINLIFLPVPPKALIYPHKISESIRARYGEKSPRLDIHHQKFYGILRDKGVNVIDLVTEFMVNRYDEKGYTYCKTDTHWSGLGCVRAAKLLALELKNEVWMKDLQKARFDTE